MSTKTLANIRDELSIETGDYLHGTVTTALTTSTALVDTDLMSVEGGMTADYFKDWWVLITSGTNAAAIRKVDTYAVTGTIAVLGGSFAAETPSAALKATYELHKHHPTTKLNAINIATRKLYPRLHRKITDLSVITGNILPDFNWWTSATEHKFWTLSGATVARTSPSAYTRGSRFSAKLTDSGSGDGVMILTSTNYPRLIDFQGSTVSLYAWAYPLDTDDDAETEIVTIQPTSTGTTVDTNTSTTSNEATVFQLIKLEDISIKDDVNTFQIKMRCVTASKNVYYVEPRLIGKKVYDYMIPELLQGGQITWIRRQITGRNDIRPADDIGFNADYVDLFGWSVVTENINGTNYKFLRTPTNISEGYRLEIQGFAPLEDNLSADTDTITIDDPYTQLLVLESAKQMYKMLRGQGSSFTSDTYETEVARLDFEISRLGNLRMGQPSSMLRVRR